MDGYSDLKARVIVKRGSTVISEFRDAEFVGVTAGQSASIFWLLAEYYMPYIHQRHILCLQ